MNNAKWNDTIRKPKNNGKPKNLVVLLHGYGANGHDLISLADHWRDALADTEFVAPDAPSPCAGAPFGRQWFGLYGISDQQREAEANQAAKDLDAYLDRLLIKRNLPHRSLALAGFSQGGMMALYVGLRRKNPPVAILSYSGALIGAESLMTANIEKPHVLLVHGEEDDVVPFEAMQHAKFILDRLNVPVKSLACPQTGHWINENGLRKGHEFLSLHLKAA